MYKIKFVISFMIILFISLSISAEEVFSREYDIYKNRFFLSVRGGEFLPEEVYSIRTDLVVLNQPAWFENTMNFKESFIFGGSIGYFFTENLGLRIDVDICSTDGESSFKANLPNPLKPTESAEVTTTVTGFASNWTVAHADLVYRKKLSSRLMFSIGAGATGVFTDIYVLDNFTWDWIANVLGLVDIQFETYKVEAYSFNIYGELQYYVDDDISLSLEGRYFHSSTEIEVPDYIYNAKLPVDMGGVYILAGLNLHL